MKSLSYGFVLAAAILWGIISIFVNKLYSFGFTPIQIVSTRAVFASIILILYLMLTNKKYLKIRPADIKYFIGTGLLSFAFFNWCLFVAIKNTSVSIATILMYTAPAFVMLLSAVLFKEKLTLVKVISLGLTFFGCMLVTGFLQGSGQRASTIGVLAGLGSGLGYALYSIFSKYALRKYDPMTIPVYTFVVAVVGLAPITDFTGIISYFSNIKIVFYCIALALFSTVLPFIFYTKGLSRLETGKASLIATLEPVVASMVGFIIFKESVTLSKIFGILLVITAIAIIREKKSDEESKTISKENPM